MSSTLENRASAVQRVGYSVAEAMQGELVSGYFAKDIVGPSEITVIFGESGAMKSFVATDIGLHIGCGRAWCGRRVRQTGVLFILGEGAAGYRKRIRAWAKRHGIDLATVRAYVYPRSLDLFSSGDELKDAIAEAEGELGCVVGLVIVDTYSTNLGDGEEQSNSDTAVVLNNVRAACGSDRGAMLVHHVGHGDKSRERGAYQLRANADRRFMVQRDDGNRGDILTVVNEKSKDDAELQDLRLVWESVDLGSDPDGDPITSLVVLPTDREPVTSDADRRVTLTGRDTKSLNVLWQLSGQNGSMVPADDWFRAVVAAGVLKPGASEDANRKVFQRTATALRKAKLVNVSGRTRGTQYLPRSTAVEPE